jgi:hypothetical protein
MQAPRQSFARQDFKLLPFSLAALQTTTESQYEGGSE